MNILHLATWEGYGAGRATTRLHHALRQLGHQSRMLVVFRQSDDPDVTAFEPETHLLRRVGRRYRRWRISKDLGRYRKTRPQEAWMFSDDRTEHAGALVRQLPTCDLLNLHAVARMVDHEHFFSRLPPHLPIVWRLPEMSPFTGGCHYSEGCDNFTRRCGNCPQLGSRRERDLTRRIWERKASSLRQVLPRLYLVAPSQWIAEQARRSSLLGTCPITVIPNGLEVDQWTPGDRSAIRHALGIPKDARVVLFVAAEVQNRLKGFEHATAALQRLAMLPGLFLLSVGSGRPILPAEVTALPRLHLGKITSDRLLCMAYNAADIYLMPSLEESFGQTAIEAMACGTPVIGFATGGIKDTVRHGSTGLLVPRGDDQALADAVAHLLDDHALRQEMAVACRRVTVEMYSCDLQARRYAMLYQAILKGVKPAATDVQTLMPKQSHAITQAVRVGDT